MSVYGLSHPWCFVMPTQADQVRGLLSERRGVLYVMIPGHGQLVPVARTLPPAPPAFPSLKLLLCSLMNSASSCFVNIRNEKACTRLIS